MVCYCKGLYVCWYNISCFDGGHSVHSDITYHVLQIIHSKSLPQVVEDSRTILLELEVTGKVLSGGGTEKTALQNVSMGCFMFKCIIHYGSITHQHHAHHVPHAEHMKNLI